MRKEYLKMIFIAWELRLLNKGPLPKPGHKTQLWLTHSGLSKLRDCGGRSPISAPSLELGTSGSIGKLVISF
jgi:hypothetical protein